MSFLILGTSIGAGILGLPLETGQTGFIPSIIGLVICCTLMFCTGWIMLNRILIDKGTAIDMATIYEKDLGIWAKYLNTFGYLITFYGLIVAYLSGAAATILSIFPEIKSIPYADKLLVILIFIFATYIIMFWQSFVEKFNATLTLVLIFMFITLIILIFPHIQNEHLKFTNWSRFPLQFPILATSFGFQVVIPFICINSEKNGISRKWIVSLMVLGVSLVLLINIVWVFSVLGTLPIESSDDVSIIGAFLAGVPATVPIAKLINSNLITFIAILFSLFAISTSYLGVGIGFLNYMKDLSTGYFKRNNATDFMVTFLLPFLVAVFYPSLFIKMLSFVGGFGVILIFGILPSLLALKKTNSRKVKILGVPCLIMSLAIFLIEIYLIFTH